MLYLSKALLEERGLPVNSPLQKFSSLRPFKNRLDKALGNTLQRASLHC